MRFAAAAGTLLALLAAVRADASCISEPVDRSEHAEAMRSRAIADFVRRDIIYKIVKMSETAMEVQVTQGFLDLPFDMKQVIAWSVFSSNFDGSDERQTVVFIDSRTLKNIARFDACRGLRLG